MSIKIDIYLNKLAQGIEKISSAIELFDEAKCEEQVEILNRLAFFIMQAGANVDHFEAAINSSGLKRTYTPCNILMKLVIDQVKGSKDIKAALSKIISLPESERKKSFKLMVSLFIVVDKSKRSKGLNPDLYWWHRDLSDENVINDILLRASKY